MKISSLLNKVITPWGQNGPPSPGYTACYSQMDTLSAPASSETGFIQKMKEGFHSFLDALSKFSLKQRPKVDIEMEPYS